MFFTHIKYKPTFEIEHHNSFLMLGSCFSNNIGERLLQSGMNGIINPFGVTYNPISIAQSLDILLKNDKLEENNLFFHNDLWNSLQFHSSFSNSDKMMALAKMNESIERGNRGVNSDLLFITWGSAHVYVKENCVVNNCHKLPSSTFQKRRLSVAEVIESTSAIFDRLISQNPKIKIVLTISPIRYLSDGAEENSRSKAVLHLAAEELCSGYANVHYFPAYEIVLDELRDYRFFDKDMIHPNSIAVDYVWEQLKQNHFTKEAKKITVDVEKIKKALNHRPFNMHTDSHQQFLAKVKQNILELTNKYPYINI